jgi:sugar/nucleoside kinase (ribokinase family)
MQSNAKSILVVGSANAEFMIRLGSAFVPDRKYVTPLNESFGGSGLNYTLRLLKAGCRVLPVLSIGNDSPGRKIRQNILDCYASQDPADKIVSYIKSDDFFAADVKTTKTFILGDGNSRTVFIEQQEGAENFQQHLSSSIAMIHSHAIGIKSVIIGHIQSDGQCRGCAQAGQSSRFLIEAFHDHSLVFANFGLSQISLGADFWEDYLNKVSIFQLNISELKAFFDQTRRWRRYRDLFKWFRDRSITFVLTLDELGAISTYKDGADGVIFSKAFQIKDLRDATGAGDAFGAGLVSRLGDSTDFAFSEYYDAIAVANYWAGYACTQFGGADQCPDRQALQEFRDQVGMEADKFMQVLSFAEANRILDNLK